MNFSNFDDNLVAINSIISISQWRLAKTMKERGELGTCIGSIVRSVRNSRSCENCYKFWNLPIKCVYLIICCYIIVPLRIIVSYFSKKLSDRQSIHFSIKKKRHINLSTEVKKIGKEQTIFLMLLLLLYRTNMKNEFYFSLNTNTCTTFVVYNVKLHMMELVPSRDITAKLPFAHILQVFRYSINRKQSIVIVAVVVVE